MTNKGRKPILKEQETQQLIDQYIVSNDVTSKIKYADMDKFCKELYNNKQLKTVPSESFWRKKDRVGRRLIDKNNRLFQHQVSFDNSEDDITLLIKNLKKEFADSKYLPIIEKEFTNKNHDYFALKSTTEKQDSIIFRLEQEKNNLQSLLRKQSSLMLELYHHILNKSSEENRHIFENARKHIFNDPMGYLDEVKENQVYQENNNISDIFKNRLEN